MSVGYSDFLKEVIPYNKRHFSRWVVVTAPDDIATRDLCRMNKIECVESEDYKRDGGEFNKGRMIERGLQHLSADAWIYHLDADIALPSTFCHELELAHLDPTCIHGFDRIMVKGWEQWKKLKASGWMECQASWYPNSVSPPAGYEVGTRYVGPDGWVPIGYSQLWHRKHGEEEWRGYRTHMYPQHHGSACRADTQLPLHFDRRKRILVPEVYVAHLASDGATNGVNWKGRKSAPFGPKTTVSAAGVESA